MKITKRQLRRIIKEAIEDTIAPDKPWGSYSEKGGDYYSDTIIMSPNGDSLLVDGRETYLQDVPTQLEMASGISMEPAFAQALMRELERQMRSGYVEKVVEFQSGKWIM